MLSFKSFLKEQVYADDEYTKNALNFFLTKFGVDTSKVTVVLKETMNIKGLDGLTQPAGLDKFVIFTKAGHPKADRLRVIAHECRHVAQVVNKMMTFKKVNGEIKTYWLGELIDIENTPYRRRPWEIDAYTIEKRVIFEFIEKFGNNIQESSIILDETLEMNHALENILKNIKVMGEKTKILWINEITDNNPITLIDNFNKEKFILEVNPLIKFGKTKGIFIPKSKVSFNIKIDDINKIEENIEVNTDSWWFINPRSILRENKSKYKTITSVDDLKTYNDIAVLINDYIKWNNYINK